jgi:SAM-dependent methyltransferase
MPESDSLTGRQRFAKDYWDGRAARDAHFSIWGDPSVSNPEQLDASAFARSGEVSAQQLLPLINPTSTCLEIGCGIGRILKPLAQHCNRVIGVDISPNMIAKAREYLAGVRNFELIVGDGATLPGVSDQSLDLVYSLLVMIHVDKRSAYRYFREIQRVLRPGGLALLQFQNMLSPKGLELFQGVVDSDYPFEFYTPQELRWLLGSVGLEVYSERLHAEFVEVSVIRGSAAEWIAGWQRELGLKGLGRSGLFGPQGGDLKSDGTLVAELSNLGSSWRTVHICANLVRRHLGRLNVISTAQAVLALPQGRVERIEVCYAGSSGNLSIRGTEKLQHLPTQPPAGDEVQGTLELHYAVIPSGFAWSTEAAQLFPKLCGLLPLGAVD